MWIILTLEDAYNPVAIENLANISEPQVLPNESKESERSINSFIPIKFSNSNQKNYFFHNKIEKINGKNLFIYLLAHLSELEN